MRDSSTRFCLKMDVRKHQLENACLCIVRRVFRYPCTWTTSKKACKKHDLESMWKKLMKHNDLEKPTSCSCSSVRDMHSTRMQTEQKVCCQTQKTVHIAAQTEFLKAVIKDDEAANRQSKSELESSRLRFLIKCTWNALNAHVNRANIMLSNTQKGSNRESLRGS